MPSSDKPYYLVGRGELAPPTSGTYHCFTAVIPDIANDTSNNRYPVIKLPFDFAPMFVSVNAENVGGAITAQMDVEYSTSGDFTGGTSILGGHLIMTDAATVSAGHNSSDDQTMTKHIRIPEGALLYCESNVTGGTGVSDVTILIAGWIVGHSNDDPADDVSAPNTVS